MTKILMLSLILVAMINPISAISISMSGDGFSEHSDYSLQASSSMQSHSSEGQTQTSIQGAGLAIHNGIGIATDDASSQIGIASANGDVLIEANGMEVAGRDGDIEWGTDFLDGSLIAGPVQTVTGGRSSAYAFTGWRWNTKDPQLKWVVKNDAYMTGEGLSASAVQSTIVAASNTWDSASNQNLFADSGLVTLNPIVATERYNKINTINWKPIATSNCLAYARTYFSSTQVGGYRTALDSDLVFNTGYNWRIDSLKTGIDFQSVALHEMGHTLGLGDLYNNPAFANDWQQVMWAYYGEKRILGNGDATGIYKLYG